MPPSPRSLTPAAHQSPAAARALVRASGLIHLASVGAVALALVWSAAAAGHVARAAPIVVPLVVGEVLAAVLQQLDRPRTAAVVSMLGAAGATTLLTFMGDASLALPAWSLFWGGALALVLLASARIADHAVPLRRAPGALAWAAFDRWTYVPVRVVLALLGRTEGEPAP